MFDIEQKTLGEEEWKLIPQESIKVLRKIKRSTNKILKDISEKIYEGFITGANDVYFVNSAKAKQLRLEMDILKPVPKGRNVKRWNIVWYNRFVIYPHKRNGTPIKENLLKNDYPNVYEYLMSHKNEIEKRKIFRKTPLELFNSWFPLIHPKPTEIFNIQKIITPNLSTENNFAYDENGKYFLDHDCYGIILNDKSRNNYLYILGILNSRIMEFYLKQISPYASGKYYRYMTGYLNKLPIKLPETAEENKTAKKIIEKVDVILKLKKESQPIDIGEFLSTHETVKLFEIASFSIREGAKFKFAKSRKKEGKIFINEFDFIQVKNKKIFEFLERYLNFASDRLKKSKNPKEEIYNIPVPKDRKIINEIIKKTGPEKENIEEEVKKLENEIDELVYEIYGISKTERKTIEDALK
jgi:hypothetical protein